MKKIIYSNYTKFIAVVLFTYYVYVVRIKMANTNQCGLIIYGQKFI